MKFSQFSEILSNLSLVSRVRFKTADGWTIFSVIRSFDGWILIDGTGFINFRFTRIVPSANTKEDTVDLFFSDGKTENYIGAIVLKDVDGVEFV